MDPHQMKADIARARGGDRAALNRVLVAVQPRLRTIAGARINRALRSHMATSDLLQSTYLDVVRSIGEFRGDDPDTLVAWITRILENNARDKARFYGRQRRRTGDGEAPPAETPARGPTPSVRAARLEDLAAVGRALATLAEDQRQVFQLRVIERRGYDEIAATMQRSEGALRMLLSRARTALAMRLDQPDDGT